MNDIRTGALVMLAAGMVMLTGCATDASLGNGGGNTVSGSAAGDGSQGANPQLEHCDKTLGTLAVEEDQGQPWYAILTQQYQLQSTAPLLKLMVQQSNCFVVVDRGRGLNSMQRERAINDSGEMRGNSNFGKGQMVAADYTVVPSINFSEKGTGGIGAVAGGLVGGMFGAVAGGLKKNEASTTLILDDNRSGVQLSASQGSAKNYDLGGFGGGFFGSGGAGLGGYSNTPQGKVLSAAFLDAYNQMVKSLRTYKAQTVAGGLGTGGTLGVDGGSTPASQATGETGSPAPKKKKKKSSAAQ